MTWVFPCGHTRTLMPWVRFPVYDRCMRCYLVAKAAKKESR